MQHRLDSRLRHPSRPRAARSQKERNARPLPRGADPAQNDLGARVAESRGRQSAQAMATHGTAGSAAFKCERLNAWSQNILNKSWLRIRLSRARGNPGPSPPGFRVELALASSPGMTIEAN